MASQAKLTIRVTSTRGGSTVRWSTTGKYVSLITGGFGRLLSGQPIQPTSSVGTFWESVLAIVSANIEADDTPP